MSVEARPAGVAIGRACQAHRLPWQSLCLATAAAGHLTVLEVAAAIRSTCHFLLLVVSRRPALLSRPASHEGFTQETAGAVGPAGPPHHLDGPMTDAVSLAERRQERLRPPQTQEG